MRIARREFLQFGGAAAVAPMSSQPALALDYPTRPVKLIVPQAPGSPPDILGRLLADRLSAQMGQSFVVDDKPGAGQNIGTEAVVHAAPDGYTLLISTAANASNASLYPDLNFNFVRDTAPIAGLMYFPNVLVVSPSFKANSVVEFIAYAKANPGKLNMGSGGNGTTPHLAGELFQKMTGTKFVHVPYRSSTAALSDLLGGKIDLMFDLIGTSLGHIKSGDLKALGVTTSKRSATLPEVPPISDSLPGYEVTSWTGLVAPAHTSSEIIAKISDEIMRSLSDEAIRGRIASLGATPMPLTSSEFAKLIVDDTQKWEKVIREANIKPD